VLSFDIPSELAPGIYKPFFENEFIRRIPAFLLAKKVVNTASEFRNSQKRKQLSSAINEIIKELSAAKTHSVVELRKEETERLAGMIFDRRESLVQTELEIKSSFEISVGLMLKIYKEKKRNEGKECLINEAAAIILKVLLGGERITRENIEKAFYD
jgi:hypothetical protein